jgi:hypothetical protein
MAQTVRSIRPYTDRVSEPEKIAPPRSEQKANIQRTPSDAKRPSAASGRKPQIAGIEHLRVLQGSDEQHRLRVQVGLLLSMHLGSHRGFRLSCKALQLEPNRFEGGGEGLEGLDLGGEAVLVDCPHPRDRS